jgi:hypothetical protein
VLNIAFWVLVLLLLQQLKVWQKSWRRRIALLELRKQQCRVEAYSINKSTALAKLLRGARAQHFSFAEQLTARKPIAVLTECASCNCTVTGCERASCKLKQLGLSGKL